jgi:hypothetical protein
MAQQVLPCPILPSGWREIVKTLWLVPVPSLASLVGSDGFCSASAFSSGFSSGSAVGSGSVVGSEVSTDGSETVSPASSGLLGSASAFVSSGSVEFCLAGGHDCLVSFVVSSGFGAKRPR